MEKENYEFLKSEYDKQIEAFKADLEQKYAHEKGQKDMQAGVRETATQKNFELSARTHGVTKKDELAVKEANNYKAHTQTWLLSRKSSRSFLNLRVP